jgi:hypothetical protein
MAGGGGGKTGAGIGLAGSGSGSGVGARVGTVRLAPVLAVGDHISRLTMHSLRGFGGYPNTTRTESHIASK